MTTTLRPSRWRAFLARYLKPYLPSWQTSNPSIWPQTGTPDSGLTSPLLLMLLLVDLGFILAHFVLFYTDFLNNELFSLRKDQGYPEFFQYIKEVWIGFLLLWQARRVPDLRYLIWAAFFGYMLADDYLMLHENLGAATANALGIGEHWGLRGQDFGELGFYLLVGGVFLALLLIAYRTGSADFRRVSLGLFGLLALFAVFAVAADLLHIVLPFPALNHVFDVIEDGGEMVVMSLIVWYAYATFVVDGVITSSLARGTYERHTPS